MTDPAAQRNREGWFRRARLQLAFAAVLGLVFGVLLLVRGETAPGLVFLVVGAAAGAPLLLRRLGRT